MQYWRPEGDLFVGDCMPFSHDGVFHLAYLLDEKHHHRRGGLGEHQWAHASTRDLANWEHHPLALAVEEEWEGSICTGSTFAHGGVYHAFYATRKPDWTQHLCHAASEDGITFTKTRPAPLAPLPEGCDPLHFRDPFVFQDDAGRFQMLVTSRLTGYPVPDEGGCLFRLSSDDLRKWKPEGPFLVPGGGPGYASIPECPDCFEWNGWHYLVFGLGLRTRYRMARHPLGPWRRPPVDLLDSPLAAVMKTAPFGDGRRIGVAWVGTRVDDRDGGAIQWGGCTLFREIVQHADGTLSTRFVDEMRRSGPPLALPAHSLTAGAACAAEEICLNGLSTQAAAAIEGLPRDFRLTCRVHLKDGHPRFGIGLRASAELTSRYDLVFDPGVGRVSLADQAIEGVTRMDRPFHLEIVSAGDIVDACIDRRRCLVNRLPELTGDRAVVFCEGGTARVEELRLEGGAQ